MADEGKHGDVRNEGTARTGFSPLRDVALVLTFLTRLPLPYPSRTTRTLAQASWAFPFAGVIVGGVGGGVYFFVTVLGAHHLISVSLGLAAMALLSGALHEDGLADVADGFGGGATKDRKLEIMHDSNIGTYGVLALLFAVGLRIAALMTISIVTDIHATFVTIVAMAVFTRGLLPSVMAGLPHARGDGVSKGAGRPGFAGAFIAFVFGTGVALLLFREALSPVGIAIVVSIAAVFVFCIIAKRQIGGQTGDVIGAAQQIGEVAFLVVLSMLLGGAL